MKRVYGRAEVVLSSEDGDIVMRVFKPGLEGMHQDQYAEVRINAMKDGMSFISDLMSVRVNAVDEEIGK